VLGNQKEDEISVPNILGNIHTNFLSAASIMTIMALKMERQGYGTIAVISSVAGDRGRQSNYVYGSAKAALSVFADGMRGRLLSKNVRVCLIKPGFVDTPMTKDYKKGLLWVGPDAVAQGIEKAITHERDRVYLPWFWCVIMFVIRSIPERIFKKLKI
jgi:short-subunit dehydrogenase